jgi:hypothetical protein
LLTILWKQFEFVDHIAQHGPKITTIQSSFRFII